MLCVITVPLQPTNRDDFREVDSSWSVSVGGKRLSKLRYADDTALTAESETELHCTNDVGTDFGVTMNVNRTKTMVVSRKDARPYANI